MEDILARTVIFSEYQGLEGLGQLRYVLWYRFCELVEGYGIKRQR
ncbi:hypothetical protein DSUL_20287 [Desulfovibrionales bacterium]